MKLTCTECKTSTKLDLDFNVSHFVCPECESIFGLDNWGNLYKKGKFTECEYFSAGLHLGQKGLLYETEYTVVGILIRRSDDTEYWHEYILQNNKNELVYLAEVKGHWVVFKEMDVEFDISKHYKTLLYKKKIFNFFDPIEVTIVSAKGFFDYPLHQRSVEVLEYICPPYMISIERFDGSVSTYFGEHISRKDIRKVYGSYPLPYKHGIGLAQPPLINAKKLYKALLFTLGFILYTQILLNIIAKERVVYSEIFASNHLPAQEYTSPSFTLSGFPSILNVSIDADLTDTWLEAAVILVNEKTNEKFYSTKKMQFYSGFDFYGHHWAEGSKHEEIKMCRIFPGKYHFAILFQKPNDQSKEKIYLKASLHESSYRNFWVYLLFSIPICMGVNDLGRSFEVKRWSASTNTPYKES